MLPAWSAMECYRAPFRMLPGVSCAASSTTRPSGLGERSWSSIATSPHRSVARRVATRRRRSHLQLGSGPARRAMHATIATSTRPGTSRPEASLDSYPEAPGNQRAGSLEAAARPARPEGRCPSVKRESVHHWFAERISAQVMRRGCRFWIVEKLRQRDLATKDLL